MLLLYQSFGFNRILTVLNCRPTVARSMSATCCHSWSLSQSNCCSIYISYMLLLTECISAKPLPQSMSAAYCHSQSPFRPNCCPIYVSRMLLLAECISTKPLPDLHQPHDVTQSANCWPIYVSHMMSLAECISAKPLPDSRQLHYVTQSASWPNGCPIHVSRMLLLAEYTPPNRYLIYVSRMLSLADSKCVSIKLLSDLCQPHSVIRKVRLSQTVA